MLNVLEAARRGACERVVYTSTVGVIGLEGAAHGRAADETCYADVAHLFGLYKRTKYVAEHEVLRAAAQGAPVSLVLPTFPSAPATRGRHRQGSSSSSSSTAGFRRSSTPP